MSEINNIDYSGWTNRKALELAKQADNDGVKGLSKTEIFDFVKLAAENNIEKQEVFEMLGLSIPHNTVKKSTKALNLTNPEFDKAIDYYNNNLSSYERSNVTYQTYDYLEANLYNMEKAIDNAFIDCDAYKDIVIVPRWHYRYYPNFNDKLINFNLEEIRNTTQKDMDSLQELKDKIEYIIEEANGETAHREPDKTEYDIEALAEKHLGMSYEEFSEKYQEELEFCKTVTYADYNAMAETQRMVYSKAKAYATEMLQTTINEAHTVNWDSGERKVEETLKATDDMYSISEFEYNGITNEGLDNLKSGIMLKSFEQALLEKYYQEHSNGVENLKAETTNQKPVKRIVNGSILIFNPDGSVYNISGQKIK